MLALNLVILSIPILLVLGAVYVLARARHERKTLGEVNPRLRRIIRWAPRAAAVRSSPRRSTWLSKARRPRRRAGRTTP